MRGGEVVELISDIGGGKTAFVSGLVKGLGMDDAVSSPSFTINNVYQGNNITVNHYDLYRLDQPGIMKHEIAEAAADPHTVVAVEWGGSVRDVLPTERLTIELKPTGDTTRDIVITNPASLSYLLEEVQQ